MSEELMEFSKITCPHCHELLSIPEEAYGQDGSCACCGKTIYIPLPEPVQNVSDLSSEVTKRESDGRRTKNCPMCGETILQEAKKCKHCGEFFDSQPKVKADYGLLLLIIPLIGTVVIWLWIPSLTLMDSPTSKIMLIAAIVVVLTSAIAAFEASANKSAKVDSDSTDTPLSWFLLMIFMWIVGYPAYLFSRHKYGLRNYCYPGFVVALIFLGVSGFWSYVVQTK